MSSLADYLNFIRRSEKRKDYLNNLLLYLLSKRQVALIGFIKIQEYMHVNDQKLLNITSIKCL